MNPEFNVGSSWSNEDILQEVEMLPLPPMLRLLGIALIVVLVSQILHHSTNAANTSKNSSSENPSQRSTGDNDSTQTIPFIVLREPYWRDLFVTLEKYRQDSSNLLKSISQSLELALHSEREMGIWFEEFNLNQKQFLFSERLQTRLDRLSTCLEQNENELLRMMRPFPVRFVLPHEHTKEESTQNKNNNNQYSHHNGESLSNTSRLFTMKGNFAGMADPTSTKNAYDCGAQVIAHIVRDWTVLGAGVRSAIYDWCREQVELHVPSQTSLPILVPGAGLGRLAFEIATAGYSVEANEISLSMTAAAHAIMQQQLHGTLFPFALDSFANEVESERRYDPVLYPDCDMNNQHANGSLSYTWGDFIQLYRWQRPAASFGCVVTSFFLDTATNIYELLCTIDHLLAPGGVWINVGPLRWHHNSMLHPAAEELRSLIESSLFSFHMMTWSVDETPSEYRHEDSKFIGVGGRPFVRSTSYEGYRPIRFVAIKQ